MTRGNQRELARQKNQKKQQEQKKNKNNDGLTLEQRKFRCLPPILQKKLFQESPQKCDTLVYSKADCCYQYKY
ncbi:unnamed protein product [Callosobruchus maculatus]|uniref:Small EDRK-rich factor-like N-terminal domain-containing protein n=1 Tax=Callosobruchus maculatus TaxID=64391 RepID=A0A653BDJ0_CALMS|nr:unnamed protein product [Callosobruchus maculatus]